MSSEVAAAPVTLERDLFLRSLLRELSGVLQDVVGLDEAAGYISVVGSAIGEQINREYGRALATDRFSPAQVVEILVDLKRRIQGDFYLIEADATKLVLGNRACPFGAFVHGRPSLCMMTSNVFGRIAADNLGYARVELEATIAEGAPGCRVVVHLRPAADADPRGREYFAVADEHGDADS